MHSSYALSAEDFAVERNGSSEPLDSLWPGGWQPDDRLGVILAQRDDIVLDLRLCHEEACHADSGFRAITATHSPLLCVSSCVKPWALKPSATS